MNNKKNSQLIPLALLLAMVTTFSSCNRGIGCPSDFSFTDAGVEIVKEILVTMFTLVCSIL